MIDHELERLVIGTMASSQQALATGMARVTKEYFDNPFNTVVFSVMQAKYNKGEHVDIVTLAQDDAIKGNSVSWMMTRESYVSASAFDGLVDKLQRLYNQRKLSNLAIKIVDFINDDEDPEKIVDTIESELTVSTQQDSKIVTPGEHAKSIFATIEKRMSQKSNGGIWTSYAGLNRLMNGGFEPQQLIIIAAKTGKGKTAFALNLMRDIAIQQKINSLYINTEMSQEQLDIRWATILAQVDHYKVATGQIDEAELGRIMPALDKMNQSGFYSITEPSLTIQRLISICRRYSRQKKVKVICVDYIGRMSTLDPKLQEHQVLKAAAKQLKTIAQELNCTMIMLAQLNAEGFLEGAKAMANEADMYGQLRESSEKEIEELKCNYIFDITKNRSGPCRPVRLNFTGETMTFRGLLEK